MEEKAEMDERRSEIRNLLWLLNKVIKPNYGNENIDKIIVSFIYEPVKSCCPFHRNQLL